MTKKEKANLSALQSFIRYYANLSQKERTNKQISDALNEKAKQLATYGRFDYRHLVK
jgi:uncharacterized protein YdgA (DUF945 family)